MAKIITIEARPLIRWMVVLFLLAPLWLVAAQTGWPALPPAPQWLAALFTSILQSLLSTLFSLAIGVWGAFGLCLFRRPVWCTAMELLVLLPVWLPTLFVLLGILNFITLWARFPFGLLGVVLVHVWINAGLVAVALARLMRARLGGQIELAWVEGASRWQFLRRCLWPQLRREFFLLGVVVFSFCLTSLAVPLIAGGPQATTLDVYAFQQVQFGQGLKYAVGIAWLELLLLATLGRLAARPSSVRRQVVVNLRFLSSITGLTVVLSLSLILLGASGWSWPQGWQQYQSIPELHEVFAQTLWGTIAISMGTGLAIAGLSALTLYALPHLGFRRWLLSLSSPSTMLVGLSLFALGPALGMVVWLKLILGLSLICFPALYRWLIDSSAEALQNQIQVARTLGASWGKIWRQITLPQVAPEIGLAAALAALWAAGDFALSGLIASQDLTLAMVIEGLLSSYRLELATWMMGWLMVAGLLVAGAFVGAGYVFGRKFKS
ncbi:MAG: hypothetical protein AB7N80_11890 [Bdellovibrionales bacterium]